MVEASKHMARWRMLARRLARTLRELKAGGHSPRKKERPAQGQQATTSRRETGLSPKTPIGSHKVKIVEAELLEDSSNEQRFKFSYRIEDGQYAGKEFSHMFKYVSSDQELQAEGQSIFADLRKATAVIEP